MRNFLLRSLVAVVAIPALLWIFHRGGFWLLGFVLLLGTIASYEIWSVGRQKGLPVRLWLLLILILPVPAIVWRFGSTSWIAWLAITLVLATLAIIRRRDATAAALSVLIHIATVLWIGVGLAAIVALRGKIQGFEWLVFLFINLWVGDTAAYLGGTAIQGPKLAPVISPNKTISGSMAQILASALIGIAYVYGGWIDAAGALIVTAAIVIAVVGQLGDLFESSLKRAADVKDISSIIPGHGGVLDRFDSALFAAPALWTLLRLWP